MKISGYQSISVSFFKTQMLQNTKQTNEKNQGISFQPGDRDMATISLFGQQYNKRIKSLMEQKQFLLERKDELINSTLEKGGNANSIQNLLDSYEEHLKELDQQISQEISGQNREPLERQQSSKKVDKPKTKQEIEQERISNLVDLSSGMTQARTVQASRAQIEGEARVLESEIKMDKGRTGDSEIIAKKEEKLARLQQKASELTSNVAEISGEVVEKINKSNADRKQSLGSETN